MKLLNKSNYSIIRLLTEIGSSDDFPFTSTDFLAKWRRPARSNVPDTIMKVVRLAIPDEQRPTFFTLVSLRIALIMPKISFIGYGIAAVAQFLDCDYTVAVIY